MLGTNEFVTKINALISSGSLTQLQVTQLSAAVNSIEEKGVSVVSTVSDLPDVVLNTGRFFYIADESRYVFSNGAEWSIQGIVFPSVSSAYTWGNNAHGQLGDKSKVDKSSPVSVVGGFADWIQLSTGANHSLGLRANGTAWAWGNDFSGVLGGGVAVGAQSSPISVLGNFTNWVQVSAGGGVSFGALATGRAYAWGANGVRQLGVSQFDNFNRSSPVQILGNFNDWIGVSSSTGVRANGTAWAWGFGQDGRLGDNTTITKSSPVSVVGGFTDWVQVSAGGSHRIGLRANGTAWGWGNGSFGKLGDNTTITKSSPVSVVGGFTDWTQVSAGQSHSLGVRANGTVWAWGNNSFGQLGDNTTVDKSSPVSVVGGFTDWIQVSAGGNHSLGLRANGTAWAWGNNSNGRLGDDTTDDKSSPVSVVGSFTDWIQVSAGTSHSAGIRG